MSRHWLKSTSILNTHKCVPFFQCPKSPWYYHHPHRYQYHFAFCEHASVACPHELCENNSIKMQADRNKQSGVYRTNSGRTKKWKQPAKNKWISHICALVRVSDGVITRYYTIKSLIWRLLCRGYVNAGPDPGTESRLLSRETLIKNIDNEPRNAALADYSQQSLTTPTIWAITEHFGHKQHTHTLEDTLGECLGMESLGNEIY